MKNLDILPPLYLMAQWREAGLSPDEIYQKAVEFVSRRPEPAPKRTPFNSEMVAFYQSGQSLRQVALAFGVSHECVRYNLLKAGVALRSAHHPGRKSYDLPANLVDLVRSIGRDETCRKLGISRTTLYLHLRALGAVVRKNPGCPRCQQDPYARGLCKKCYQLWLRRGKPELNK